MKKADRTNPSNKTFVPLNVPIARRRQTLSLLIQLIILPACILTNILFVVFYPYMALIIAPIWCLWAFVVDTAPFRGGRPIPMLRGSRWLLNVRSYFPSALITDGTQRPDEELSVLLSPSRLDRLGCVDKHDHRVSRKKSNVPRTVLPSPHDGSKLQNPHQ